MNHVNDVPRAFVLVIFLSACSGGGGGPSSSSGGTGITILPAPPAPAQENGLPYGVAGQSLSDAETVEVAALRSSVNEASGTASDSGVITLESGFFAAVPTARDALADFLDESITMNGGEGTLANGQTVRLFYDPSAAGAYAAALQLATYAALEGAPPPDPANAEAHFLFGFLSDPDVIDARISGTVRYAGDIAANGLVRIDGISAGDPTGTELDGSINITVNFADDWITGDISATYTVDAQTVGVDLALPHTAFGGNTFAGTFICASAVNCVSDTQMDAGFFGPSADEVGGVLEIETTNEIQGEEHQFLGAGSFVIAPRGN
jgi:hypothetical protein